MLKTLRVLSLVALGGISGCVRHQVAPPAPPPPPVVTPPPSNVGPEAPGTGVVSGTVTDSTGAVVPGAQVTVYNAEIQRTATTNGSGYYAVTGLPWGTYSVLIISSGFTEEKITGVVINVAESAQTNVVLRVGTSSTVQAGGNTEQPATIPGFPPHPPLASAWVSLPRLVASDGHPTLGDFDRVLSNALDRMGYGTKGYYSYPDGFALATRIEQIFPDGRSMPLPARFSLLPPVPKVFSLSYLEGIVVPRKGYFRIIVFIVTDLPIIQSENPATSDQAAGWPSHGATKLPSKISKDAAPDSISVTAFVYEFKNSTADDSSKLTLLDSATIQGAEPLLDAKQHLQESGLWAALGLP